MKKFIWIFPLIIFFVILTIIMVHIPIKFSQKNYELSCMRVNDNNFYISGSFGIINGETYSCYVFYAKNGVERIRYEIKTEKCRIIIKEGAHYVIKETAQHPALGTHISYIFYLDEKYISNKIIIE